MSFQDRIKRLFILFAILGLCKVKVVLTDGPQTELRQNTPVLEPADFGQLYHDIVNDTRGLIYEYRYVEVKNKTTAVRVTVDVSSEADKNFPVLFVIRQQQGILSWQIPLSLEYTHTYYRVSRTLCPVDVEHRKTIERNQTIYVGVSTMYQGDVEFDIRADILEDFKIETRERKNISLTSSEPQYFMYSFSDGVDSVVVEATSDDDYCMVLSVQDILCPVMDQDKDAKFEGVYQTMSKKAAITIERKSYQYDSVYIVMVLKLNDFSCNKVEKTQPAGLEREKSVSLYVYETISAKTYMFGILGPVVIFLLFYIVAFFIVIVHVCNKDRSIWTFTPLDENFTESGNTEQHARSALNPDNQANPSYSATSATEDRSTEIFEELGSVQTGSVPVQGQASPLQAAAKTELYVSDLAKKEMTRQDKNYKIYWRNIVALSIFYGLPVIQLVITYQKVLHITGNQDICYYNFDCAHPLGNLTAFNNVFSNIGYVMLGILFLILVYRRSVIYKKALESNPKAAKLYGIPQHSGLFYAMGLGLCMEGVMSACYHVCPTYSNFQFDTSYMYIIACLCMLRIYQNRHSDIIAKAHTSYLLMALVIFIAVIGVVVHGNSIFWTVFACCDILVIIALSVHVYYMGRWKIDKGIFKRVFLMVKDTFISSAKPVYMDRFVMLIVAIALNWSFAIYGAVTKPGDFASFLLGIFIGNLLLYSTFYIIMKIRYKEKIRPLAIVCIILACIVWGFALYFFFFHLTSWQLTPAYSRAENQKCMILGFYDAHDVWHFLSATSMFFSFLILLTLDDDLFLVKRDRIPVF